MSIFKSSFLVFSVVFLSGCWVGRSAREEKTQHWIQNAKRPIRVIEHNAFGTFSATPTNRHYTLIDQSGKVFLADGVRFQFPPIIE
jgi:hypothetical protein